MQTNTARYNSTENHPCPLDVVRAVYRAYAARDLAAIQALYHPDCEIYQSALLPWGGELRGRAGLQQFFIRLTSTIDTEIVDEQLFEAGDRVVSIGRTRGKALATGRQFELPAVHVYTVREGTICRYEAYVDTPAMLSACTPD
ncbi:MAG: nuclear transport factor 2 family protein [Alphaproteobacteria bacterium]|nr:nuclear transport factor 2 family protein [Rhizobiaceae bacterium]MBU3961890.1 nuclear transport factor 2 family protein [Alphaproteobacteria bacterium]MBU4049133.1 nuclear transport factor 2 family protein [Alphaproteobacteria bacterium]MBU4091304.1 nuclear transport factor 2 family protein [Alphaproteobacteria bacterium]MBU4156865.1 nuclear transport factor 2 family protein [Alphaproteobacteria bacterium]